MTFADGGLKFHSNPTPPPLLGPKHWFANTIHRMVQSGEMEQDLRFVAEADYKDMMRVSEDVALAIADARYRQGKTVGIINSALTLLGIVIVVFGIMMLSSCSAQRPKPVKVSSRTMAIDTKTFLYIKFTDDPGAWPVRIVSEDEIRHMVPGTPVMMCKVADSMSAQAQAVRGPRHGEAVMLILILPNK